jgi:hypothetical protein
MSMLGSVRYLMVSVLVCASATTRVAAEDAAQSRGPATEPALNGNATPEEISSLIRDLGDASYDRRTRATRRLTAIGQAASEALKSAAEAAEFETARRAKAILRELDAQWLLGVEVTLSFSRSSIVWDEPVDLILTFHNPTRHASRLPFQLPAAGDSPQPENHAEQVGHMLDAADFLTVRGQGGAIDPRVDDIASDEAVHAMVESRLKDGPSGELAPGERVSITIPSFNRGWARYPLLDTGDFEVVFEHQPEWTDTTLTTQRVGLVRSPAARVTVTRGAPEAVSRAGVEALVALEREEGVLIARLTNTSDLPSTVNLNIGSSAPFAQARWIVFRGEAYGEVAVRGASPTSLKDFDAGRLATIAPGESVELARVDIASLRPPDGEGGAGACRVHLHYQNLLDRRWQQRQASQADIERSWPPSLRTPLPSRVLTGSHSSDRVEILLP